MFPSVPGGFRIVGTFRYPADAANVDFALKPPPAPSTFASILASDTHISPQLSRALVFAPWPLRE